MGLFDFLRPRVEAKASAAGPMIVSGRAGQAQWTARDPQLYARDGYQRNPIVYRAVRMVAASAASLPIMAMRGKAEVVNHPALAVLAKPNPFTTGRAMLEGAYAFRLISGNCFLEAVKVGSSISEMHVHRTERVKVIPGGDGYPAFYEFQVSGQTMRFPIDPATGVSNILHLKDFHPLDDFYGMSPLDPAAWAVDAHSYGSQEVTTSLSKGGVPVGGFKFAGNDSLTDAQMRQAREMFIERLTESKRDRMPAVLNNVWDWLKFGATPKEQGLTELKADAAREICFALGVPPMLLGIPGDNTYANYAEANRAFWRETVIPFAEKNLAEIGDWIGNLTGERDFKLMPNTDGLPALASERAEMWSMLNQAEFITVNEKREAAGYSKVTGGDIVLVASSDVPLEDAGASITGGEEPDPADELDEELTEESAAKKMLEGIETGLRNV